MKYSTDKDLDKYLREIVAQGWSVEVGRKHIKIRSPYKGYLVTCSLTPSCPYAHKKVKADVERMLRKEREEMNGEEELG